MNNKTQVFLSYKYHDKNGQITSDYHMAKELYKQLTCRGINTFFSDDTIMNAGRGQYKQMIDEHLDDATMLVVVATTPENCNSNWVRYEWDSFYNDILSERKTGELISYLDTNDISEYPRTIRNLQSFNRKEHSIDAVVHFIVSYFGLGEQMQSVANDTEKGSSYNYNAEYDLGDEKKRLAVQASIESKNDFDYISSFLEDETKQYNVLDVGCSVGTVTFDVFCQFGNNVSVLGVDKFESCVKEFNANSPRKNIQAEVLNFEDDDWCNKLENIMSKHLIKCFDLIYCSLSLHHMSDSESVIKKLWKYINTDGYIYIRTCDDMLKLAYPKGESVYKLIQMTASVSRVSDRFHGRKVYSMLHRSKYRNINIRSLLIDTAEKDIDEKYAMFYSAFVWRKNYFKTKLDTATLPDEIEEAMNEYNEVMDLLSEIEEQFLDSSFYFGYYVIIAFAQKKDIL